MSVCSRGTAVLPVDGLSGVEQLCCQWTVCRAWNSCAASGRSVGREILYWSIFRKSVECSQVSLKSDKKVTVLYLNIYICAFMITSRSVVLRTRNRSNKSCTFWGQFIFSKIVPFMRQGRKVLYSRTGRTATDDSTIWRMCIACRIPKATKTHNMQ